MGKAKHTPPQLIYVCAGGKCKKRGSKDIARTIRDYIKDRGLQKRIGVIKTHCTDNCDFGPVLCLQPQNIWHFGVSKDEALALLGTLDTRTVHK